MPSVHVISCRRSTCSVVGSGYKAGCCVYQFPGLQVEKKGAVEHCGGSEKQKKQ